MTAFRAVPVAAVALAVSALSIGCDSPPPPPDEGLSGKVLYGGVPLAEGRVTLVGPKGQVAGAPIRPDGSYRVEKPPTGRVRVGVAVYDKGSVRPRPPATVKALDPATRPGLAVSHVPPAPAVRIPERYADPGSSGLVCQVDPGQRELDIQLAVGPGDPAVVRPDDVPAVGLTVGQTAPEIEGDDLEGVRFKLSDYRGKVVVVAFYGHWCTLSCADFAPVRAMADAHRGRPFVILGVNTDEDRARALARDRERNMPWRSWWDGSVLGPVSDAWQIPGLPYYVVLDGRGVVRGKNLVGDALGRLVADLTAAP